MWVTPQSFWVSWGHFFSSHQVLSMAYVPGTELKAFHASSHQNPLRQCTNAEQTQESQDSCAKRYKMWFLPCCGSSQAPCSRNRPCRPSVLCKATAREDEIQDKTKVREAERHKEGEAKRERNREKGQKIFLKGNSPLGEVDFPLPPAHSRRDHTLYPGTFLSTHQEARRWGDKEIPKLSAEIISGLCFWLSAIFRVAREKQVPMADGPTVPAFLPHFPSSLPSWRMGVKQGRVAGHKGGDQSSPKVHLVVVVLWNGHQYHWEKNE